MNPDRGKRNFYAAKLQILKTKKYTLCRWNTPNFL